MIKFGTDGWRGKIGDAFTDANLEVVAQATADFLRDRNVGNGYVVLGYDNRFRSEEYADIVAEILSSNGFEVLLASKAVSTPVVSFVTKRFKASLGICITASHNPPTYNGYKIKENFGGSALDKTIEDVKPYLFKSSPQKGDVSRITKVDLTLEYLENLREKFDLVKIAGHFQTTPVHLNYMHGSSSGYVGAALRDNFIPTLEYNLNRDILFGGVNPEPTPANLKEFIRGVHSGLGFAFDGDGDRLCAVTQDKEFVSSSQLMSVMLPRLMKRHSANRGVFSVSCSDLVVKQAAAKGLDVERTKIGFKYIADEMIKDNSVLIGGEESGGIGFAGYMPERDGIASCLMVLEALAYANTTLSDVLDDLDEEFGPHIQRRLDLQITNSSLTSKKLETLAQDPSVSRLKTNKVETLDGVKLYLEDGSWIMFRQSGTEPVVRIYAESRSEAQTQSLIQTGKLYLLG